MIIPDGSIKYSYQLLEDELNRLGSSQDQPLSMEFVRQWLNDNWEIYQKSADKTYFRYHGPFSNEGCRSMDAYHLFTYVYFELSNLERYHRLDEKLDIELKRFLTIQNDPLQLESWFGTNFEAHWDNLHSIDIDLWEEKVYKSAYSDVHISLDGFENCIRLKELLSHLYSDENLFDKITAYEPDENIDERFTQEYHNMVEKEKLLNMERVFPNLFEDKYKSNRSRDDKYSEVEFG
ncbi:MAG TPA: hypothetical protein VLZ54_12370 [Arenibacter sp.]|nr:hypothetical protein [Arenibacter sp.]